MIAAIGAWVKNLIFLVLFAAFLELLLPAGSMKKFLRLIIGIFLLTAVLQPAVNVLNGGFLRGGVPSLTAGKTKAEAFSLEKRQKELACRLYKKELSEQMEKVLASIPGITDVRVEIELAARENLSAGELIRNVAVKAKMSGQGKKIKVELRKNQEQEELNDTMKNKIRERLKSLYQIPEDKISFG